MLAIIDFVGFTDSPAAFAPAFQTMVRSAFYLVLLSVMSGNQGFVHAQESANSTRLSITNSTSSNVGSAIPVGLNASHVIDLGLEQGYRVNSVEAAKPIDDSMFARRIHLDLVGRVPRTGELDEFLSQTNSSKRSALVDRLLASDEHAVHMAEVYDAILIGRTNVDQVKKRMEAGWLAYLRDAVVKNRPWNQITREIVLARPSSPEARGAAWYLYARKDKHQDIAEAVSKDIFGVRIDCAQCHDHPLADEIKQKHYWGLVAFFNRSKNVDTPQGPRISESAIGGFSDFANLEGSSSPNELRFLEDRYVEEVRPGKDAKEEDKDELYVSVNGTDPKIPKFSRREQFVEKVLADHPLLGKAMVNRIWGWMMGRGLVHPVDSLDSFHPASHPELLDWLSRDFVASGYDVRRLIKAIASSQSYQLDSANTKNVDPKWFATALPKPLTAEMLQRSMLTVLEPVETSRWDTIEKRVAFANLFPDVLTEESIANVAQGLLLSNSDTITELVSMKQSRFLQSLAAPMETATATERLFLRILGRNPASDEVAYCKQYIDGRMDQRERAIEGLAWAMITSAEFRFNH
ncbi:MAG: DUF1549 domain-containing protein [Planctomycetota bacterium]|nr:DUF1549 domain-containing protein [Planctomycetota bacterium]